MKNRNVILMAVMAGFLAIGFSAFADDATTVVNTDTSGDNITVVNTDTTASSPTASPQAVFVNNGQANDDQAEGNLSIEARNAMFAEMQTILANAGADVVCSRDYSLLFVEYEENSIVTFYITPGGDIADDGVTAKEDMPDATLRRHGEGLCEQGVLETFENAVNRAIAENS